MKKRTLSIESFSTVGVQSRDREILIGRKISVWGIPIAASGVSQPTSFDCEMMRLALAMAREAMVIGEVPVGAVVVFQGRVVSQAYNLRETLNDPTAHAERLALSLAGHALGSWRLEGCTLYATLEPCPMCAGAMILGRITRVVYGVADPKAGACDSLYRIVSDPRFNHRTIISSGILAKECGELLTHFFQSRRPVQ